ncbi:MAG: tRNA (N6-threonylcarbamoyladenosine(37)-N6)-methyltransferase TrmO [Anaerolineae bacterium]
MVGIAAQVSLYPLRQQTLSPAIDEALQIFRAHALDVELGAMSTLISGDDVAVFAALQEALRYIAEQGQVVMVVTLSNACPVPSKTKEKSVSYTPIGHVENDFRERAPADEIRFPLAERDLRAAESRIVLDPALIEGLKGLEPGQQVLVVFYFHRSEGFDLLQHPRGDTARPRRGVFALRSPRRPNPIGVTVVDLLSVEGNVLRVRGLDAINGTPVLDLKPA